MPLPPLRFSPILKPRAWGGRGLVRLGKALPTEPASPIGESWEVADLGAPVSDGISMVASGPLLGTSIRELMLSRREELLGHARDSSGRFPLLVKYLDAAEFLSVQVHPTAEYASRHPGAHLKTEAWFVVHAAPGAAIFRGVHRSIDRDHLRVAIERGAAEACLQRLPVRPGDYIPLTSGICHALGAGVLVAEVQTPSDTTFRIYDWDRRDPARPLHVEESLECVLLGEAQQQELDRCPVTRLESSALGWSDALRTATLGSNEHFTVSATEAALGAEHAAFTLERSGVPDVIMLISGAALIECPGFPQERLTAGDTMLLPAVGSPATIQLAPGAVLLQACPNPPFLRQDTSANLGRLA